jgi:serine/threonine protein phosphatase PrpC
MPQVSSAVASHTGLRRPGNEDAFCVRADLGLYVVADGMGGHAAGEVASKLAIEAIEEYMSAQPAPDAPGAAPIPAGERLTAALLLANRRLGDAMAADAALRGMATTAAAVLIADGASTVAHVGDSRVYRWRGGRLQPLTQDHSWVGEQVRAGVLTDADARRHPWRNVVTRAIGGGPDPAVDVSTVDLQAGDRLLLCSDGL